jgi:hypothetical protein
MADPAQVQKAAQQVVTTLQAYPSDVQQQAMQQASLQLQNATATGSGPQQTGTTSAGQPQDTSTQNQTTQQKK